MNIDPTDWKEEPCWNGIGGFFLKNAAVSPRENSNKIIPKYSSAMEEVKQEQSYSGLLI